MKFDHDTADIILKALAGVGAVIAYAMGYKQYKRGQEWQKASFLAALIAEFESSPKICAVRCMLDWDRGDVRIDSSTTISFDNEVFLLALRSPVKQKEIHLGGKDISWKAETEDVVFEPPQGEIRDALDVFFDFFEKLESYWAINLLSFEDLRYFYYWFESLRSMDEWKNKNCKDALDRYIRVYRFNGVVHLLEEYSRTVKAPPGFPTEDRLTTAPAKEKR